MISPTFIKSKLLTKKVLIVLCFLMTFFMFGINTDAAYFKYSEFDFDEFAEENKTYWTDQCVKENPNSNTEKCVELVLSRQRQFYTRLYKILAKHQANGTFIDDNIILMTIFFELDPDFITDDGANYYEFFGDENKPYNYDPENDLDDYEVEGLPDKDFFSKELDTIDLLIRSMFSYKVGCYAVYGDLATISDPNNVFQGNYCANGNPIMINGQMKCGYEVDDTIKRIGFWEYAIYKLRLANFFGMKSQEELNCLGLEEEYPGADMQFHSSDRKRLDIDNYWTFLENSTYFDNKPHLQKYFQPVLINLDKTSMKSLTEAEYEEHQEEIILFRKEIVSYIKEILAQRGTRSGDFDMSLVNNLLYWWPIGSNETTMQDGKQFAIGNPAPTTISSRYGPRNNSIHYGVDLAGGVDGELNIIAARSGIVERVVTDCISGGSETCGGNYGNYVTISHGDGNYTLYAHLHQNTITVNVGDSVSQGQVIGKMGNSGTSSGTHLHFEIRVGSNTKESAVNPLNFISIETPRLNSSEVDYVEGNNNKQTTCRTLMTSNFSKSGVIALMVNVQAESSFNPTAVGDNGDSYGLFQWHKSRKEALMRMFPGSYSSIPNQVKYLIYELDNEYTTLYKLLRSDSVSSQDLAYQFCFDFERPYDKENTCRTRAQRYTGEMVNYVDRSCN